MGKLGHILGAMALLAATACTKAPDSSITEPTSRRSIPAIQTGDLTRAVTQGDQPRVLELLNAGADINENSGAAEYRITPLIAAVVTGNYSIAAVLIRNGAALDPTYKGYSAEDLAHFNRDDDTANLIRQFRELQARRGK